MAQYINPEVYNDEMIKCIKAGKLSNKMVEMFTTHAYNVTRRFYIPNQDDKNDAVGNCLRDFCLYWKNFTIENCIHLKFATQFLPGDKITICIKNFGDIECTAGDELDIEKGIFKIENTVNRSIRSMMAICQQEKYKDVVKVNNHSVSYKFAVTDLYNKEDLSIFSFIRCEQVNVEGREELVRDDIHNNIQNGNEYLFRQASKVFLFMTSLCTNSIIKSLSQTSPAPLRFGNRVRIDGINRDNNGLFSL